LKTTDQNINLLPVSFYRTTS